MVEGHAGSELVSPEGGLAFVHTSIFPVFGLLAVLQERVVDDGRGAEPLAPSGAKTQRGGRIAPSEAVLGSFVRIAHPVVACIDPQRKRMAAVYVVRKLARDVVESETDGVPHGCQNSLGEEVAGGDEVRAFAAHERTVRRAGQRQRPHRKRLPVVLPVALAGADLRQRRKAGAVGRGDVTFRHFGRLHRLTAEDREQSVGVGLVIDRHVVVENLRLVIAAAAHQQPRHAVLAGRDAREQLQELEDILFSGEQRGVFELFDIDADITRLPEDHQRLARRDGYRVDGHGAGNAVGRGLGQNECRKQQQ